MTPRHEEAEFFRWLTVTHTQRWHAHYHTSGTGHLYQGRFKAFPVQSDEHLYTVLRYAERHPRRAKLVTEAEAWRRPTLWRYDQGGREGKGVAGGVADWASEGLAYPGEPT